MTVTIDPTDKRSVRGLAVLATADRWVKGHRKADGRAFFAIPGSMGRIYFTDTRNCSCPDRRQRDETCKHIRAVRLWAIQEKGTGAGKAPATPTLPSAEVRVIEADAPAPSVLLAPACRCGARIAWDRRLCDACRERDRALLANDF